MILYHGSTFLVDKPEIRIGKSFLDFGVGFYLTTSKKQAERWAKIKMNRNKADVGFVSIHDFDMEKAKSTLNLKEFPVADEEWLKFVADNRRGISGSEEADIHIGPVADDNIYQTIRLFETGAYDAEYTVKKLKTEVLHDQWALHTNKALSLLTYTDFFELK